MWWLTFNLLSAFLALTIATATFILLDINRRSK